MLRCWEVLELVCVQPSVLSGPVRVLTFVAQVIMGSGSCRLGMCGCMSPDIFCMKTSRRLYAVPLQGLPMLEGLLADATGEGLFLKFLLSPDCLPLPQRVQAHRVAEAGQMCVPPMANEGM